VQVVKTAGNAVDDTTLQTLAGDVLYHYAVTNTGDVALTNVKRGRRQRHRRHRRRCHHCTIASLAVGVTDTSLTHTFTVNKDTTNIATATGTTPIGGTVTDTDDAVVDVIAPAVQVVKTAGNAVDDTTLQTLAGDVLYHYAVTNTGDVALTNVNVVDDNGTADTGDDVTIGTIASLAVGVTDTSLTHTFTVNKDTTNIATATVPPDWWHRHGYR